MDIEDLSLEEKLDLSTNSPKVFEQLYEKYARPMFNYIFSKVGDKKIAEDLLQDVFIEFWEKRLEVQTSAYGFILQIAKYKIFNHYRSERVRDKYIMHLGNFLTEINELTPHKYLEAKELMLQIEALIDELAPQCKKVFYMSRFEHKSNTEIAEELNLSKRTVENYISSSMNFIKHKNKFLFIILFFYI
ncbi:RNA polymerase sigma-70 factor [Sphingobacterium bovistauri]|uniref:RNA polymerase sigma-70 factor n=1 Tax=Sphingobacterium bovistauri TaxID=2781959 RepID=A0ABS7Z7S3_9SPHI|nr:RNA polymerase sigma-70 factor [Sphingobacterium bovistauri]MCA5006240.1 RNA polymerase sigma-70 factor [Sphingobacterium bovistauri]